MQQHTGDARWGAHAQRIASGEMWHPPRPGGNNDQAHPPIHPTRYSQGEGNWSQEKARTCKECSLLLPCYDQYLRCIMKVVAKSVRH